MSIAAQDCAKPVSANLSEAEPAKSDDKLDPDQMTLGQTLRRHREMAGLTLAELGAELCISRRHIASIEQGRVADLPPPVFALGFVRTLAIYFDLDPEQAVSSFRREHGAAGTPDAPVVASMLRPRQREPFGLVAAALGLAGIAALWIWFTALESENPAQAAAAIRTGGYNPHDAAVLARVHSRAPLSEALTGGADKAGDRAGTGSL